MKYPLFLSDFHENWNFLDRFSKKMISYHAERQAERQTDRQADMTKLTFAFRNITNATNERVIYFNEPVISKKLK